MRQILRKNSLEIHIGVLVIAAWDKNTTDEMTFFGLGLSSKTEKKKRPKSEFQER